MTDMQRINVAIAGTLTEPRKVVAAPINATSNGCFVADMNLQTHYLVCEKHDSRKARIAAQYGTAVISEATLREFLKAGIFPDTALPGYTPHHANNFPDIVWVEVYDPPQRRRITYRDFSGNYSVRTVVVTGKGTSGDVEYLGAYDGPDFKTFRTDRILSIDVS